MRYEVPQFIEVEDKIIGPFTWRQFIYLSGGIGAVALTYLTLPFFLFVITGVPIGILAGFLAFHKVNDRPFAVFLESLFNFFTRKKVYLWRKGEGEKYVVSGRRPAEGTQPEQQQTAAVGIDEEPAAPEGALAALSAEMQEKETLENAASNS